MTSDLGLRRLYRGRRVMVTGATSGNGREAAHRILDLGGHVVAIGRNQSALADLARRGAEVHEIDLADVGMVADFARRVKAPATLLHLAGNSRIGTLSTEEIAALYRSDLLGPMALVNGLIARMPTHGRIGLVTSVAACMRPVPGMIDYQAVKARMVDEWRNLRFDPLSASKPTSTLVMMGLIGATKVWHTYPPIPRAAARIASRIVPGPDRWVDKILVGVGLGRPVVHVGIGGALYPVVEVPTAWQRVGQAAFEIGCRATSSFVR